MKNLRTKILILLIISIWTVMPVYSADIEDLQKGLDLLTEKMKPALPFNSTMGLNWSDGYIGQITDLPPRFGIGISTGFTSMDFASVKKLLNLFGLEVPFDNSMNIGFPIPGLNLEGRIGGIKYPFDVGFKIGYLPPDALKSFIDNFNYNYFLIGADLRYSLINRKIFIPKLSVGLGINYMQGGITSPPLQDMSYYNFTDSSDNKYMLSVSEAKLGLEWRTINAELKVQASFPFKFITPYVGAGIGYAWSQTGYKVTTSELSVDNGSLEDIKDILKQLGVTGVSDKGFETIKKFNGISTRAFGGISINIAFFRIDITGMYEFIGGYIGGTLGMRFQL